MHDGRRGVHWSCIRVCLAERPEKREYSRQFGRIQGIPDAMGGFNMPMQAKRTVDAASSAQIAPGSTRRGFILTAAAAASSTLVQSEVARAAIVQTDTAKLPPLPL